MKSVLMIVAGALAFVLCSCRPGEDLPQDRFRLSVEEVMAGEDMMVSVLKITAPRKSSISVDAGESHNHVTPGDPLVDGPREGEVVIAAARVAPGGSPEAFIQVLLRARDDSGYAGGPAVYRVPADTKLEDVLELTAAAGTFPMDAPLKVGELRGQPIQLTVGQPTK